MTHSLRRTSPLGEQFVGTCTLCGKSGLTSDQALEECENPGNISQDQALLNAIKGPMTLEELDQAMRRDLQLHESVEVTYVVNGWIVIYSPDDYHTSMVFRGSTPIEALISCFSEVRNWRGRE